MSSVNHFPDVVSPVVCDFGWGYGISPARLPEYFYQVGSNTYPPGKTTLGSNKTLPVVNIPSSFGSLPALQQSFESAGSIVVDDGTHHDTVYYTGLATVSSVPSFTGCTGGTHTFSSGAAIYDPRFYVDSMPLNTLISFDAIDHYGLGLPVTVPPTGVRVLSYQWDFGNGVTSSGPFASTTYTHNIPPPEIQATLTVIDSLGRTFSCAHRLNLLALTTVAGATWRIRQSNLGYR